MNFPFKAPQSAADRCTCQPGRDLDGSEFGPCGFCEAAADEETRQRALERDAARWRFTQRTGFYLDPDHEVDDIEPNVSAVYLGHVWVGVGHDDATAIDCAIMLVDHFGDDVPVAEILSIYSEHYHSRWNGAEWEQPTRPSFAGVEYADLAKVSAS